MTRHARNCTAGAVYTYHEKKKDANTSGYGTTSKRLGKDSVKDFDCCSLSLQPCQYPVITKNGILYEKDVILEYIIAKKRQYCRDLKKYEKSKEKEDLGDVTKLVAENNAKVNLFVKGENNITTKYASANAGAGPSSISNMAGARAKELPSFWVPGNTPNAEKAKVEKPDKTIFCPVSGKPLSSKELVDVKFTLATGVEENKSLIAKQNRYMCPVTHDILGNSVPCAVIKTTGDVVTLECVEKIIKKDWIHPLTNEKLREKDIIIMERGGTGYSQTNSNLEGKQARPALQA